MKFNFKSYVFTFQYREACRWKELLEPLEQRPLKPCSSGIIQTVLLSCCGVGNTDVELLYCSATIILCYLPFFFYLFAFYFSSFIVFPFICFSIFLSHCCLRHFSYFIFSYHIYFVFFLLFLFNFVFIFLIFYSYMFCFNKPLHSCNLPQSLQTQCCVTT